MHTSINNISDGGLQGVSKYVVQWQINKQLSIWITILQSFIYQQIISTTFSAIIYSRKSFLRFKYFCKWSASIYRLSLDNTEVWLITCALSERKRCLKHTLMYNTTLFQRWYRKWCVKYMAKYGTCFYSCFCTDYITYIYSSHVSVLTWHISIHFTLYTSCFYTCCTVQVAYFYLYTMLYILHLVCIRVAVLFLFALLFCLHYLFLLMLLYWCLGAVVFSFMEVGW